MIAMEQQEGPLPGKRIRKPVQRRSVDYAPTVVRHIQARMWQRDVGDTTVLQPVAAAALNILPTLACLDNPSTSFTTKFVHSSTNKVRTSINRVLWTPSGRRLITGSQSGEFTLWNGMSFNFEMIIQAHDNAVRSMVWSHNENWMVTGDDGGCIKYWQPNMNNVKANKSAHKEPVRDLSFSNTDLKYCSCSDDTTIKIWDFARCQEERSLTGHGWDVKSVDWHPEKSLLVSGAKDSLVKLWDARTGRELSTLHGHKTIVLSTKWNKNGNWVLTGSRDQTIKLFDIRTLKELETFRGHKKEVTALAWHPFHEELFVSGSYDGCIVHWLVGHEGPQAEVGNAHDNSILDLAWHPMGHILCSGGNDHTTKFWCRNRPGDTTRDKYASQHLPQGPAINEQVGARAPSAPMMDGPPAPFLGGIPGITDEGTIPGIGMAVPMLQPGPGPDAPNRPLFAHHQQQQFGGLMHIQQSQQQQQQQQQQFGGLIHMQQSQQQQFMFRGPPGGPAGVRPPLPPMGLRPPSPGHPYLPQFQQEFRPLQG